jgi:hypothetical protein
MNTIEMDGLSVRELTNCELQMNGGFLFPVGKFVGFVILSGLVGELIIEGWEKCKADFIEGWNSVE